MALRLTREDLMLGAAYRVARKRRLDGKAIREILVTRCGFSEKRADLLAPHWVGSINAYWKHAA